MFSLPALLMLLSLNDTLQTFPSKFQREIRHEVGWVNNSEPFIARQGIDGANAPIARMGMIRDGFAPDSLGEITLDGKAALCRTSEYQVGVMTVTLATSPERSAVRTAIL